MRAALISVLILVVSGCGGSVLQPVDEPPGAAGSATGSSGSTTGSEAGSGSSGTTGTGPQDGSLCSPCTQDVDCGEPGLASCVGISGSSFCAPSCVDDTDCDSAARCVPYGGASVCMPTSGTCEGFVPGGPRDGGSDSTTGSGSSSGSSSGSTSSGSSSSSSGSTGTSSTSGTTTGTSSSSGSTGATLGVGLHGGTVERMHFLITGDTRPPACEDTAHYPTTVINKIADAATSHGVQFALDMGDHMFVCNNQPAPANAQMSLYMHAVHRFANPWFMTLGNHECMGTGGHCGLASTNANYLAFMNALSPVSSKPYYKVDIHTSQGLATFVFVADNSWTTAQESWLKSTLATADANAKYTIIVKHHPAGDTSVAANATIMSIVRAHKFSLLLTGHAHHYGHPSTDQGREIILGIGGAPLTGSTTYHGYAIVDQKLNGNLRVTVYSLATGLAQDTWAVPPN